MRCYRYRLRQISGAKTPWHSDTLWGQLCWIYRDLKGEPALIELLQEVKSGAAPFVVSDGFPAGFLPLPAGGSCFAANVSAEKKSAGIEQMKTAKHAKRLQYLPQDQFNLVIQGEKIVKSPQELSQPPEDIAVIQTKNVISRLNNTVEENGLYQLQWTLPGESGELDVYVLVREDFKDTLKECFEYMAQYGFGGKVSIGLGAFEIKDTVEFTFPQVDKPNCFITLSHCTPCADMPTQAHYKLVIKYGKLGHDRSRQGEPFKKPVIQFEPGAVFWGPPPAGGYCGCLVENVAFDYADTVQCGLSIAVPARMKEVD